jgi:hypothetical protein
LTRSLNEAKAEKLSMEKKRLKTLKNVVSFADFVQKEGDFFPTYYAWQLFRKSGW